MGFVSLKHWGPLFYLMSKEQHNFAQEYEERSLEDQSIPIEDLIELIKHTPLTEETRKKIKALLEGQKDQKIG